MSDKSPKKSSAKTAATRSLKEKRADKKTKAEGLSHNEIGDAVHKKR